MKMNRDRIIREFRRIKKLGYLQSKRGHNTGIGKTFEDYLGVKENNLKDPDFAGFEVKSQRELSNSYITLFTKSPSHPKGANRYLRDAFGKPDSMFESIKVLHTSCFGNKYNTYLDKYGFRLKIDKELERVIFEAKHLGSGEIIDQNVYWTFESLNRAIEKKLKGLLFVTAETRKIGGNESFHYTKAKVFINLRFEKFLSEIQNGAIMFDVRIGAYKTHGKASFGRPHDHGSGFRIKRENLPSIFDQVFEIHD